MNPSAKPMNVLWIVADQLRADCLGYRGHPVIQTPCLDALAAQSFVFHNAFVQTPVCMGSRASMMTGRYPTATRSRGMGILPPGEITIAEDLKRKGFRTGMYGKLHLTPEQYTRTELGSDVPITDWRPFQNAAHLVPIAEDPCKANYGFDDLVPCDDLNRGLYLKWGREQMRNNGGASQENTAFAERPPNLHPEYSTGGLFVSPVSSDLHHSTFIAAQAAQAIRQNQSEKPWFNWCSFIHPHHPFEAPQDQLDRYPPDKINLPDLSAKSEPSAADVHPDAASGIGHFSKLPEEAQRTILRHYYASISLIDDNIGKLVDSLKQTGQWDNTIIIFSSDHGEFVGEHGLLTKPSFHYDDLIRVPLLIRVPGQEKNPCRLDGLIESIDIYPTLLGFLNSEIHPGVQGTDWSADLINGTFEGRSDIYCESYPPLPAHALLTRCSEVQTLRTREWKLSVYPQATREQGLLFDLANDPNESVNLYRDENHREIREEVRGRLLARKFHTRDPLPIQLSQY